MFFESEEAKREYINEKIKKYYPAFRTGGFYFRQLLTAALGADKVVVDAGCGDGGIISEFVGQWQKLIGLDQNKELLDKNIVVDEKIFADLTRIPLADSSVDVIVSQFVLEHLAEPSKAFEEFNRILKPGGRFIFITPNIYHPIMLASRILPFSLHKWLRKVLLKKEEESHRTFYRANSRRKLLELGKSCDFNDLQILRAGNPEYLGFCKATVVPAILFEKLLSKKPFKNFQMYIMGEFEK